MTENCPYNNPIESRVMAIANVVASGVCPEFIANNSITPKTWEEFAVVLHDATKLRLNACGLPQDVETENIAFSYGIMANLIRYAIWSIARSGEVLSEKELRDLLVASFDTIAAPLMSCSVKVAHHIECELGILKPEKHSLGRHINYTPETGLQYDNRFRLEKIQRIISLISEGRGQETTGSCGGFVLNRLTWPTVIHASFEFGLAQSEMMHAMTELYK